MLSLQKICFATAFLFVSIVGSTEAFLPPRFASSSSVAPILKYRGGTTDDACNTRLYAEREFAVVVQAEIEPDRMAEFLKMIETNAVETRKEPGCIRFDVLRSQDNPNHFTFYELYENMAAIDYHKKQPHYNLWAEFKESGGTIKSVSFKNDAEFLT